ncbi:Alkaline proteinase inhibitor/ Outer membrane lipoprotein Omp19 [Rhabdaerophilaceae bacterium]
MPKSSQGKFSRFWRQGFALAVVSLALCACESSQRLGSLVPGSRPSPVATPAAPPPLVAAPTTDANTETLPPPPAPGASAGPAAAVPPIASPPVQAAPALPAASQPPVAAPSGVATAPGNLPRTVPPVSSAPAEAPFAPSRTSLTGNWSLSESAGTRCRLTLSSAPKLDLYGAATSGCSAKELQRVNAWELNGSEVILYEPGGAVVGRLRQSAAGAYSGVSTRSGAPISMAK